MWDADRWDGLTSRVRLRSRASLGLSVPSRCTQKYQREGKLQLLFSLVVKESFIKSTFHLRTCHGQECWYSLMDTPFLEHNNSYMYLNRCTHTMMEPFIRATKPLPLAAIYIYSSVSVIARWSAAYFGWTTAHSWLGVSSLLTTSIKAGPHCSLFSARSADLLFTWHLGVGKYEINANFTCHLSYNDQKMPIY